MGTTFALRLISLLVYPYAGCYTYLERRVTIDSYTNVISLWSALILIVKVFANSYGLFRERARGRR